MITSSNDSSESSPSGTEFDRVLKKLDVVVFRYLSKVQGESPPAKKQTVTHIPGISGSLTATPIQVGPQPSVADILRDRGPNYSPSRPVSSNETKTSALEIFHKLFAI